MFDLNTRVLSLAAAAFIALPAYAATPGASTGTANTETADISTNAAQTTADRDFGQVSQDGTKAFQKIDLARLAIFNGQTARAQQYVQQAETLLTKAQSDDKLFTRAESELKVPAGTTQRGAAHATPSTTRVAWLPIGGMMTINEDFTDNKAKGASVAQADAQVKKGDTRQALDTLKLHDVGVSFLEEVAPLQASLKGVQQASGLLSQDHFFATNQALKTVDDGVRIDQQTYVGSPNSKTASATK